MKYFLLRHEYPYPGSCFIDGDVVFAPPLESYYKTGSPLGLEGRTVSVTMDQAVRKLEKDFSLRPQALFCIGKIGDAAKALSGRFADDSG